MHTWCAWDALFIPELIGRAARVRNDILIWPHLEHF